MIVGQPVLVVIDIQDMGGRDLDEVGIAVMDGYGDIVPISRTLVDAARRGGVPVVFFQEAHRRSMVDYGRELDGTEGVHCMEGDPGTELHPDLLPLPHEAFIRKRRYSCFFGTDLEIVLKGLGAKTLILIGGLTDVCVHYTFADAHQHDYFTRVVTDAVAGSTVEAHRASLAAMEYLQSGACRTSAEILEAFTSMTPEASIPGASTTDAALVSA